MRTLIVDDQAMIRTAVRSTLEDCAEIEIVGEALNGQEAIEQTVKLTPDLIIMDISMPVLDGLSAAERIKEFRPKTRILMFSMHTSKALIDIARKLGLSGFVAKEDDGPALRSAVGAVLHNKTYFPASDAPQADRVRTGSRW